MKVWINEPLPLFDAPQYAERVAGRDRAYEGATDEWREAVYLYAVEVFLPAQREPFIFESLSRSYDEYAKLHDKPLNDSKRAFAGIQHRLKREKLIEVVPGEFGRSFEFNIRPKYRATSRLSEQF